MQRSASDEGKSQLCDPILTDLTGISNQDGPEVLEFDDSIDPWICLECGRLNDIRSSCLRCGRDRDTGRLHCSTEESPGQELVEIIAANEAVGAVFTLIGLGILFLTGFPAREVGWVISCGTWWALVGYSFLNTADQRRDWPATKCEITRIRRTKTQDVRKSLWWVNRAWSWSYKYTVHGTEYRGSWVSIDKPDSSTKVFYNPYHPEQSTGDKMANSVRGLIDLVIGLFLLMAGLILLAS